MAYKIKKAKPVYRVLIHTAKTSYPVHVATFNVEAKTEKEADKIGLQKARKDNPDKPKNYYFATTIGYGTKLNKDNPVIK
jgi:hypothetical protein